MDFSSFDRLQRCRLGWNRSNKIGRRTLSRSLYSIPTTTKEVSTHQKDKSSCCCNRDTSCKDSRKSVRSTISTHKSSSVSQRYQPWGIYLVVQTRLAGDGKVSWGCAHLTFYCRTTPKQLPVLVHTLSRLTLLELHGTHISTHDIQPPQNKKRTKFPNSLFQTDRHAIPCGPISFAEVRCLGREGVRNASREIELSVT